MPSFACHGAMAMRVCLLRQKLVRGPKECYSRIFGVPRLQQCLVMIALYLRGECCPVGGGLGCLYITPLSHLVPRAQLPRAG